MGLLKSMLDRILGAADRDRSSRAPVPPAGIPRDVQQQAATSTDPGVAAQQGSDVQEATRFLASGQKIVNISAVLDAKAQHAGQELNWRQSIVDLMKLVGMDSSLTARKQLAAELGYTGDTNDSATMNVWLHRQVMQKLADNGGDVPGELLRH
jgi:hypothetical protein